MPEGNNAHPVVVSNDFVNLHAHERILAHPLDLPSQRGEAVQAVSVEGKINGNDVGSIVGDTSKPPKAESGEQFATFAVAHLGYKHKSPATAAMGMGRLISPNSRQIYHLPARVRALEIEMLLI